MSLKSITNSILVAACICGKDGVISQMEEEKMFQLAVEEFPGYQFEEFQAVIDEFFDSSKQIEEYLEAIRDPTSRKFTLELAKESASVDGLDARENIALQKAYLIWEVTPNE